MRSPPKVPSLADLLGAADPPADEAPAAAERTALDDDTAPKRGTLEARRARAESVRRAYQTPEVRARHHAACKAAWARPGHREHHAARICEGLRAAAARRKTKK
jgi:hypothetical protein